MKIKQFSKIAFFLFATFNSQISTATSIEGLTREYCEKFDGLTKDEIKAKIGSPPDHSASQTLILGAETIWLYYGKGPKDPDTEKPLTLSLVLWEGQVTSIKLGDHPAEITDNGIRAIAKLRKDKNLSDADPIQALELVKVFTTLITTH